MPKSGLVPSNTPGRTSQMFLSDSPENLEEGFDCSMGGLQKPTARQEQSNAGWPLGNSDAKMAAAAS